MSTWDDRPNDYEHALVVIECLNGQLEQYRQECVQWDHQRTILKDEIDRRRAENERLRDLAAKVCWFDWSDNDADAVAAIDELRQFLTQESKP